MRSNRYRGFTGAARRFFDVTGIPVPRFARRAYRAVGAAFDDDRPYLRREVKALRREVELLRREVDRMEMRAHLDSVGRRPD